MEITNNIVKNKPSKNREVKMLIYQAISDWISGKDEKPLIERKCSICNSFSEEGAFLDDITEAKLKYKTLDGHTIDIALMKKGEIFGVIKITNALRSKKPNEILLPFIEFNVNEILENKKIWKVLNDNLNALICNKCESNLLKFKEIASSIASNCDIVLPANTYYRYGVHRCWNCKKEMIVFAWPTNYLWDKGKPVIEPLPPTIKFIEKLGYWGNVCSSCDNLQGDFHLKSEPDGAFFCAGCEDDSKESFNTDMLMIAYNASLDGILDKTYLK